MALSFGRPRYKQVSAQIGPGGGGSGHRHGGCGLLVVIVDPRAGVIDPGRLGDLRERAHVKPGYHQLVHGSLGAEHQLVHR